MMKRLITFSLLFPNLFLFSQNKVEVYNYKIDYYYDSVNYESKSIYFGEIKNNKFYKSSYAINIVDSLEWINDSTFVECYSRDSINYEPYSYVRIKDTLFIEFKHYLSDRDTTHPQFSFKLGDTLWDPLKENYFYFRSSSKHFPRGGYTIYLGDEIIQIDDKYYSCHKFKKESKSYHMHSKQTHSQIIYIEQNKLIPVKLINNYYTVKTDILLPQYSVVYLNTMSESIPTFQFEEDLIIYKDTSLIWTKEQQEQYYKNCYQVYESEEFCNCLMNYFNGRINYYELQLPLRKHSYLIRIGHIECK